MKRSIRPCTDFHKSRNTLFPLFLALYFIPNYTSAQTCDPNGNLIIFSNYDGGELNIRVDVNIPNLKIGICSYEPVRINISGPFSSSVTEVLYAGFNSSQNNDNCNIGNFPTSISGVPASNYTIQTAPPVTVTNPNGYNSGIICAYSCNLNSDQGGCNTINQVVAYFTAQLGGNLYALNVQYCCWLNGTTYSVAALSGSCCQSPNSSVSIAYTGSPFCTNITTPQSVNLTGSGAGTYTSAPAGLAINPVTGAITPSGSIPGAYAVTYTVPGCPGASTTTTVQIIDAPAATITYQAPFSEAITTPQPVELTGPSGGSFISSPGGLNLNAATGAITPALSLPGTYTVTYIPPASPPCPAIPVSTEVTITTDPANNATCKVYFPNVFSPNDDGINDTFYPFSNCPFESYEFLVFSRWGELIFKTNNPQDKWNGTFNSKVCEPGVYVYSVAYQVTGQAVEKVSGSVNLVR